MDSLFFALNVTMPIFLTMALGMLLRRVGVMSSEFAAKVNNFVFLVDLPFNLFIQLAPMDFFAIWDTGFVLFCFFTTAACIAIAWILSRLVISAEVRGEFIQASYRSSASLLGLAYIQNMYGNGAMGGLMILGSVPLYNIAAVFILELLRPGSKDEQAGLSLSKRLPHLMLEIITNPIILGIVAGFAWSVLRLPIPAILDKTCRNVAQTATPMGLIAMGATLDPKQIRGRLGASVLASALKLVGFALLFTPVAVLLGFRTEKLIAALVMFGSATTFSGYVMAKNMGHEGILSQTVVILTTLLSAFTLTGFIWVLRSLSLL